MARQLDVHAGAYVINIQRWIGLGGNNVEKNKQKIKRELKKILNRKEHISKDMYNEVEDLLELFENGTSYNIIFSSLAGFVSRYHPYSR